DMNEAAEWHQLEKLAGHIKSAAFAVGPLVADLAARPRLVDADRHRPAVRTEHPFLNQRRLRMRAIHRFRRSCEAPGNKDLAVPLGLQRRLAHWGALGGRG